ncbi:hypothetical protein BJ742DRAFT_817735 [Cladochytrium replicatum]|nr:hypothetical protein BJ742DRAFT_817735 [Cladochytrium replicatum]
MSRDSITEKDPVESIPVDLSPSVAVPAVVSPPTHRSSVAKDDPVALDSPADLGTEPDGSTTPPAPEDEVVVVLVDEEPSLPTTVEELQALVLSLRKENAELKAQLSASASAPAEKKKVIPDVAPTGKLQHITRGRIAPRAKVSKPTPEQQSETVRETTESPSEITTSEPPVDPAQAEEARKKRIIMNMGGVNPLMGFDPSSVVLKQRSAILNRGLSSGGNSPQGEPTTTSSSSPTTPVVVEKHIERVNSTHEFVLPNADEGLVREWIGGVLGDGVLKDGDIKDSLKDGQVLVKLINAVKPDANLKVNTGRFTFMHLENINNFLKVAEQLGVPRNSLFAPTDLTEGSDVPKVVNVLGYVKTLVDLK